MVFGVLVWFVPGGRLRAGAARGVEIVPFFTQELSMVGEKYFGICAAGGRGGNEPHCCSTLKCCRTGLFQTKKLNVGLPCR
eukprot:COSAG06_NODE_5951_length_3189_cov_2.744743_2_plen_81_part_00